MKFWTLLSLGFALALPACKDKDEAADDTGSKVLDWRET